MRFTYAEAMTDPSYLAPLAQAAEEARGTTRSWCPTRWPTPRCLTPATRSAPTARGSSWQDKPFLEPFALISALAMVTERIRFTISVLKLPIRHPVHTAKLASTAAVLSDNRLSLGVGVSPWPEDYEITSTPWAHHGQHMDGAIDVLSSVAVGQISRVPRRGLRHPVHQDLPRPHRARADPGGWAFPGHAAAGGAAGRLDPWRRRRRRAGGHDRPAAARFAGRSVGTDQPFEIQVISPDAFSVDGIRRFEEMGVTDVIVGFRWPYTVGPDEQPLQEKIDHLRRYADGVIAACRD